MDWIVPYKRRYTEVLILDTSEYDFPWELDMCNGQLQIWISIIISQSQQTMKAYT